jgi:phospholipid-binding lipoprotein MlaA
VIRFVINSTVGVGGFYDVLGANGVPQESGDFGQTLYRWGVPPGPYLVLPILGPSDPRDAIGKYGVDGLADPFNRLVDGTIYNEPTLVYVREGVWGIDLRSRNIETIDEIKASSLDFYTHFKSIARQHRAVALREARGLAAAPPELTDPGATPEDPQP